MPAYPSNEAGRSDLLIPRKLHFIWVGDPMPEHLADNCQVWTQLHPDWEVQLWTEREIDEIGLQNRALYDQAEKIVPRDAVEQFRADIVRYEILALYGGFYADADTRPLRSIEPSLEGRTEFAAAEDRNWIGNTYLGAIPGHLIMQQLIALLPRNVHRYRGKRPNWLSGPRFLTPVWRQHGGYVAPTEQFYPYSYSHVKQGTVPNEFGTDVVAVHGWDHTRRVLEQRRERNVRA